MLKLITICLGTVFLMYLSGIYYPTEVQRTGHISRSARKPRTDIFMAIAIFWLTCFMFLRTNYNDTYNYILYWSLSETVEEFLNAGGLLDYTGNPFFRFWEVYSHEYIGNYHVYFFPSALLISIASVKLIRHYSVNPAVSILIYFSVGTYVLYMAAMKQALAMAILLASIPYAEKKQYVRFCLLVCLAVLFHTHAFMFAIVPFLFEKPWGKITWLGLCIVAIMMATYDYTLGVFMEFAESIGILVADIEVFDGHAIHPLRIVVYWIPSIIALLFRRRLFSDSSRIENFFINMCSVSACILTVGLVQAANLFARMAGYFEIAFAIALPWMMQKLFNKRSVPIVYAGVAALYFVYFLYEFGVSKSFGQQYSSITLWQFFRELFS